MILGGCPELNAIEWRCVIIDEAHRLKNKNCKLLEGLKLMNLVSNCSSLFGYDNKLKTWFTCQKKTSQAVFLELSLFLITLQTYVVLIVYAGIFVIKQNVASSHCKHNLFLTILLYVFVLIRMKISFKICFSFYAVC